MSNSSRLLGQTFKKALQQAATQDDQGVTRDVELELFPDHVPRSNVELVQACADFYDQHQVVIDAALELGFGQISTGSSAAWDVEHRIILHDFMSALEHELHAAEVSEGCPAPLDV